MENMPIINYFLRADRSCFDFLRIKIKSYFMNLYQAILEFPFCILFRVSPSKSFGRTFLQLELKWEIWAAHIRVSRSLPVEEEESVPFLTNCSKQNPEYSWVTFPPQVFHEKGRKEKASLVRQRIICSLTGLIVRFRIFLTHKFYFKYRWSSRNFH